MNVGFIGTGWTERVQINIYKLAGLTPYAISSRSDEKGKLLAEKFNLRKYYTNWRDLIIDPNVDVVSIATPTYTHFEIASFAIQYNKVIICQAPFMSAFEIENLIGLNQKHAEAKVFIDFELRFTPARLKLKELLDKKLIGSVFHSEITYKKNFSISEDTPWSWEHDLDMGGGMLNIVGDALIDLSLFLLGDLELVQSYTTMLHQQRKKEDSTLVNQTGDDLAKLTLKSDKNGFVEVIASSIHGENEGMTVIIRGTEGILKIDAEDRLWNLRNDEEEWKSISITSDLPEAMPPDLKTYPYAVGTYYFGKALASNDEDELSMVCSLVQALQMQKILDAAQQDTKEKN